MMKELQSSAMTATAPNVLVCWRCVPCQPVPGGWWPAGVCLSLVIARTFVFVSPALQSWFEFLEKQGAGSVGSDGQLWKGQVHWCLPMHQWEIYYTVYYHHYWYYRLLHFMLNFLGDHLHHWLSSCYFPPFLVVVFIFSSFSLSQFVFPIIFPHMISIYSEIHASTFDIEFHLKGFQELEFYRW